MKFVNAFTNEFVQTINKQLGKEQKHNHLDPDVFEALFCMYIDKHFDDAQSLEDTIIAMATNSRRTRAYKAILDDGDSIGSEGRRKLVRERVAKEIVKLLQGLDNIEGVGNLSEVDPTALDADKATTTEELTTRVLGVTNNAPSPSLKVNSGGFSWHEQALCPEVDPEIFFPGSGMSAASAKRVCGQCAVQAECLSYALDNRVEFGIWGGLSWTQRRKRLKNGR